LVRVAIPAQKRARRADRLAAVAALVAEIEADAVLDAHADGIDMAKRAVLRMQDGRTEAERRLIIEVYQELEGLRRAATAKIRERLATTTKRSSIGADRGWKGPQSANAAVMAKGGIDE